MQWRACFAFAFLLSTRALAEPRALSNVELEWMAPPECPVASQIRARIAAALEADASSSAKKFSVRAVVDASRKTGWHLDLEMDSEDGTTERALDADSCEQLADAATFIIALTLTEAAHEKKSPLATPSLPATPRPLSSPPRWHALIFRPAVRPFLAGDFGSLRYPVGGSGLAFSLLFGSRWRLELAGSSWMSETINGGLNARVKIETVGAFEVRSCFAPLQKPIEIGACLAAQTGYTVGRGSNVSNSLAGGSPWVGGLAGVAIGWHLTHHLSMRPTFDISALAPPRFRVLVGNTSVDVFHASPISARLAVGLEGIF